MLYNINVLRVFYTLLGDVKLREKEEWRELLGVAGGVVKGLMKILRGGVGESGRVLWFRFTYFYLCLLLQRIEAYQV